MINGDNLPSDKANNQKNLNTTTKNLTLKLQKNLIISQNFKSKAHKDVQTLMKYQSNRIRKHLALFLETSLQSHNPQNSPTSIKSSITFLRNDLKWSKNCVEEIKSRLGKCH